MARKRLLVCGIPSSLVFNSADILAITRWEESGFAFQGISELIEVEAPTRPPGNHTHATRTGT